MWCNNPVIPYITICFIKPTSFVKKVEKFLTILPITILSTLWFQNLFDQSSGVLPEVNYANFTASLPTLVVAILSKDLLLTIFVGVISYVLFTTLLS